MYVSFVGNLTRDAEEVEWETKKGETVRSLLFTVAESIFHHGEKRTEFVACISKPLSIAKFLTKGKRVAVCGNAVLEHWTDRHGTVQSGVKVAVFDVKLL